LQKTIAAASCKTLPTASKMGMQQQQVKKKYEACELALCEAKERGCGGFLYGSFLFVAYAHIVTKTSVSAAPANPETTNLICMSAGNTVISHGIT
jgi:hypothetical protein